MLFSVLPSLDSRGILLKTAIRIIHERTNSVNSQFTFSFVSGITDGLSKADRRKPDKALFSCVFKYNAVQYFCED